MIFTAKRPWTHRDEPSGSCPNSGSRVERAGATQGREIRPLAGGDFIAVHRRWGIFPPLNVKCNFGILVHVPGKMITSNNCFLEANYVLGIGLFAVGGAHSFIHSFRVY